VVYTDDISVKYLQSLKVSAHNRLARWALLYLQPYQFTIKHVEGKKLTAADGLSRRPYDELGDLTEDEELQEDSFIAQTDPDIFDSVTDNALKIKQPNRQWHVLSIDVEEGDANASNNRPLDKNLPNCTEDLTTQPSETTNVWSTQDKNIRLLQHESKDLQPILSWLEDGILPETDKEARPVILQSEHFQLVDGLSHHLHYPRTKRLNKLKPVIQQPCVPDVLREDYW